MTATTGATTRLTPPTEPLQPAWYLSLDGGARTIADEVWDDLCAHINSHPGLSLTEAATARVFWKTIERLAADGWVEAIAIWQAGATPCEA